MLTQLKLSNFKAWSQPDPIALKPVTMLLGTNSSGKSSLIQSLLLLKQTVQSPDRTIHLNLGGDEVNDLFNFGDFDNVLFHAARSPRQFSLGFSFKAPKGSRIDEGEFFGVYGQTPSGSVAVQEVLLETGARRFRAVRREKGAYSMLVDQEVQPRGKGRNFAPERVDRLSGGGHRLSATGRRIGRGPEPSPSGVSCRTSPTWDRCAASPSATMCGTSPGPARSAATATGRWTCCFPARCPRARRRAR
jgi:hypothetical protein